MRFDEGNIASPQAQQIRDARKQGDQSGLVAITKKLLPERRGQNEATNTTRQGRTIKSMKPETPKPGQAIY